VRHVDTCGLDTSLTGPPNNAIPLPTPSNDALSSNWWARPPRLRSTKSACSAGCGKLARALAPRPLWATQFFLQIAIRRRADERTRTADLVTLRVRCYICRGMPPCLQKAHKQANSAFPQRTVVRQIPPNIAHIVVKTVVNARLTMTGSNPLCRSWQR
jgi:hypothetical protein